MKNHTLLQCYLPHVWQKLSLLNLWLFVAIFFIHKNSSVFPVSKTWTHISAIEWNFAPKKGNSGQLLHCTVVGVNQVLCPSFQRELWCHWNKLQLTEGTSKLPPPSQPKASPCSVGNVIGNAVGSVIFSVINSSLTGHYCYQLPQNVHSNLRDQVSGYLEFKERIFSASLFL